mmetsp:Transcript_53811/g.143187  ORF Transcript_53811/g.143187 Transcript_53811/m.143187 type:complete len:450 (+) Transcript_53811:2-1351(+)
MSWFLDGCCHSRAPDQAHRRVRCADQERIVGSSRCTGISSRFEGCSQGRPGATVPAFRPEPGRAIPLEAGYTQSQVADWTSPALVESQRQLLQKFDELVQEAERSYYKNIREDTYLTHREFLVRRYLPASDWNIVEAERRILATLKFRAEFNILSMHEQGAAERIMSCEHNPGVELYFADSGKTDYYRRPFLIGRYQLANPANVHPWRHVMGCIFVLEHMANKIVAADVPSASFIMDVSALPEAGTVCSTGGGARRGSEADNPYFKADAGTIDAPSKELLTHMGVPNSVLSVVRVGIQLCGTHYPDISHRIIFLNADLLFWGFFKLFSMWVTRETRRKYVFVGKTWRDEPMSRLLEWYPPESLPVEWGGTSTIFTPVDGFLASARDELSSSCARLRLQSSNMHTRKEVETKMPGKDTSAPRTSIAVLVLVVALVGVLHSLSPWLIASVL